MPEQAERHIYLHSTKGGANKDYNLHLVRDVENPDLWRLTYENGKHGMPLKSAPKLAAAVPYDVANKEFDRTVAEKMKTGGYLPAGGQTAAYQDVVPQERRSGIEPQLLESIPLAMVLERMDDPQYTWEEKKDGERRPIRKTTDPDGTVVVVGTNRDGLIVAIPKVLEQAVAALPVAACVLDGEDMGQGRYAAFDLISQPADPDGQLSFVERRAALHQLLRAAPSECWIAVQYADTPEQARQLDADVRARGGEGLVGKRKDAPYKPGSDSRDQFKYPYLDRVTCFVEGIEATKRSVRIAVLGANGETVSLKKVTIPQSYEIPKAGAIVDVEYLYAYTSGGLAQPRYQGVRGDRRLEHCVASQLKFKQEDECARLFEPPEELDVEQEPSAPCM